MQSPSDSHIMISYQWNYQPLVVLISDMLKKAGFKIWIDIDYMRGSTLESMAGAIEQASSILICLSETYKNSPSCRTEAEYAFKLRKDIVPLKVESGYDPDGWLGILIGTKLYFKCHSTEMIQKNIHAVQKELTSKTVHESEVKPEKNKPKNTKKLIRSKSVDIESEVGTTSIKAFFAKI